MAKVKQTWSFVQPPSEAGAGLHHWSVPLTTPPREFRRLPIVYHEPTEDEWQAFLDAHEAAAGRVEEILDFGDGWLKEKQAFSATQLKMMRAAWSDVRAHRMRHGGRLN